MERGSQPPGAPPCHVQALQSSATHVAPAVICLHATGYTILDLVKCKLPAPGPLRQLNGCLESARDVAHLSLPRVRRSTAGRSPRCPKCHDALLTPHFVSRRLRVGISSALQCVRAKLPARRTRAGVDDKRFLLGIARDHQLMPVDEMQ